MGFGQVLAEPGRLVVERGVDALERPVLLEELGGGLVAHPRHAGQVVGGVAPQGGVLDVLLGLDPVPLLHVGAVGDDRVGDPPAGVEDLDVVVDQLERRRGRR